MALVKEDGSVVTSANSYADATDLDAYVLDRDITLTASTTAEKEALLYKAMDYLARYLGQWKGDRVSTAQELAWPRSGVYVDGQLLASDEIPRELFYAQMALAVAADSGTLMPTRTPSDKGAVIKEKVDVLEVAYANPGSVLPVAADSTADALLGPLLRRGGTLTVIRA